MKYFSYKILMVVGLSLLTYTACDHDRLDLEPLGETENNYYTAQIDFERTAVAVYAKLSDLYWYNGGNWVHDMRILPGDDITSIGNYDFDVFGPIQAGNGDLQYYYKKSYELISRANILLQKIAEEEGVYTDSNLKNYHQGEALFLRGFMFFNLWNFYGNAPIITERIQNSSEINQPGSQGTEMLDQAIEDLQQAAQLLPGSWDEANLGRVTSNSANGMLGKALMFRAAWNSSDEDYTSALNAFNAIQGRSLIPVYSDNFSAFAENNEESLFEFQASQAPGSDNVWLANDFDNNVGALSAYWGFYDNNFSLFGNLRFIATSKLINAYGDDPRGQFFVDDEGNFLKYVIENQLSDTGVGSVNNPRLLRYADVLLLKAEALVKTGGSTAEAIGLINQIRTRAREWGGGAVPANYDTGVTDQAVILEWIRNERFLELAGEDAHRWFDLRRWHQAGDINLGSFDFSTGKDNFNFDVNKHVLFPIPTNEVDLNPNVPQNPGY